MKWVAPVVVLVLLAAASYETAIAVGWLAIGPLPGEGPRAEEQVLLVAVVAQLASAVLAASYAFGLRIQTAAAESMIPLAVAAFMTARFGRRGLGSAESSTSSQRCPSPGRAPSILRASASRRSPPLRARS